MSLITQKPSDYVRCYGCGDVSYHPDTEQKLTYCTHCGGNLARLGVMDVLIVLAGYSRKQMEEGRCVSTL